MSVETRVADERPRLRLVADLKDWQALVGPFYSVDSPQSGVRTALLLQQRHMNAAGSAHLGVLNTLAELAMQRLATYGKLHCSLVQFSSQVLGPTYADRWLYAEAVITGRSKDCVFTVAEVFDDAGPVVMSSAVWAERQLA